MHKVGFDGGPSLIELGPAMDVQLFFDCVAKFAGPALGEGGFLILDRLYRRYLRLEDLIMARALMKQIEHVFAALPSVRLAEHGIEQSSCSGNISLLEKFGPYFRKFEECCESSLIFHKTWKVYQPVRLVISDMPHYMDEKDRPLSDYDALEGKPFWLRDV